MKTKRKFYLLIIVTIIALIAISAVWYFSPKSFLSEVEPSDIKTIAIRDGTTGKRFVINDSVEIEYIVKNIQSVEMKRGKVSVGYVGYTFNMSFHSSDDKEIDSFIINSADTIRDDPFFYRCSGGLCFDYLKELEIKYIK